YLAGGSGLALHLNHRQSFDLDLYSPDTFDAASSIASFRMKLPAFKLVDESAQTVHGISLDTEISLFHYSYRLLEPTQAYMNFPVASISDIAAMKVEAIAGRGLKRDFFDLFSICTAMTYSLDDVIIFHQKKYTDTESMLPHIFKSFTYFADAETKPERAHIVD